LPDELHYIRRIAINAVAAGVFSPGDDFQVLQVTVQGVAVAVYDDLVWRQAPTLLYFDAEARVSPNSRYPSTLSGSG